MASVTVLALNGRRQVVKVTPNTTILQILEEVCAKQKLNPDEFDVKHHSKVLDTTSIFRFSGLPNNAQLELVPVAKPRQDGAVMLGIQLEDGSRLTGTFQPDDTLWSILQRLCPERASDDKYPVIIYMRSEIYGSEAFCKTTLKSLGLTSGRAMLRLIHRKPEQLRVQANVSAPLPVKPTEEKPYKRTLIKLEDDKDVNAPSTSKLKDGISGATDTSNAKQEANREKDMNERKQDFLAKFIKQEKNKKESYMPKPSAKSTSEPKRSKTPPPKNKLQSSQFNNLDAAEFTEQHLDSHFTFLGERNALIFDLSLASAVPQEDLPDEFFELTVEDARNLLRDLKEKREELEQRPLQTSAFRDLEESKRILRQLNTYKKSVLRIQFPNRYVLQGTFSPVDTFATVIDFVRNYLENKKLDFYLYTTPPKHILDPKTRLIDANCVPGAVVHFGVKGSTVTEQAYLRKSLMDKLTTPATAALVASITRLQHPYHTEHGIECPKNTKINYGPSTSKSTEI